MYKTQKVQKCYLKCSIYKINGPTAVFVLSVLQIIRTLGPPDIVGIITGLATLAKVILNI